MIDRTYTQCSKDLMTYKIIGGFRHDYIALHWIMVSICKTALELPGRLLGSCNLDLLALALGDGVCYLPQSPCIINPTFGE